MSSRRSFIQGLLAVPLALRFGSVLAATEPIPEPPAPKTELDVLRNRKVFRDAVPEGWRKIYGMPELDSSVFKYKNGKAVSVANSVIHEGKLYDVLLHHGKQWI